MGGLERRRRQDSAVDAPAKSDLGTLIISISELPQYINQCTVEPHTVGTPEIRTSSIQWTLAWVPIAMDVY